jgi:hypothetical protein
MDVSLQVIQEQLILFPDLGVTFQNSHPNPIEILAKV